MFHDLCEEVVLTCAYGRPNQPKQTVRGRWLNAALTIGLACRLEQAILMAFAEQRMLAEPGADVLRISACGFTEPERGADLRAMRLNGTTRCAADRLAGEQSPTRRQVGAGRQRDFLGASGMCGARAL